jgi:hypothetical protein
MSAPISSLTLIAKTSISTTHYLPLADGTSANYKLLIQDLFPNFNTIGTSSELLYVNITNKNTLNFKGIKSFDNLLTVSTVSNNIVLQVNPANIDLSLCDNTTSAFITGPVSLSSGITGTLPVANGGTGLTTLTSNSLFVGNGTSALTALGVATNGQIPIGRTGLSPVLATLTAGTNVTVTNASGAITIAASLTTLTANLNGAGYNIYGLGWLSGDGQNEGVAVNSTGKVFVGGSTPTAFYTYDLNVNSGIALNGAITQSLEMIATATPGSFTIQGASASVANVAAGTTSLLGGNSSGTGNAGGITLRAGNCGLTGSGNGGLTTLEAGGSFSGTGGNIQVVAGGSNSGTGGNVIITPGGSTSGTGGKVVQSAGGSTLPFTNFTGTSGAASANSLSSSVATAGAKTGAIKVQINGVDAWIRVYATAE